MFFFNDSKTLLPFYSRQQGKTTYHFYINAEGKLSAEYVVDGVKKSILSIMGIPSEWQQNLTNTERKEAVKTALDSSYFNATGFDIVVNPRGLGGWGDEVHEGSVPSTGPAGQRGLSTRAMPDSLRTLHTIYGTYDWATEVGFSDGEARQIATSCKETDAVSAGTAPYPVIGEQYIHFNMNGRTDGDSSDSRIIYAIDKLKEAINDYNLIKSLSSNILTKLGQGLHALQDTFAHLDIFVSILTVNGTTVKTHWSPIPGDAISTKGNGADDPLEKTRSPDTFVKLGDEQFCNQRYSDTKTATYLYLAIFLCNTLYSDGTHTAGLCSLISGSGAGVRVRYDGPDKNVHRFHGLLTKMSTVSGIIIPPAIRALFYPTSPSPSPSVATTSLFPASVPPTSSRLMILIEGQVRNRPPLMWQYIGTISIFLDSERLARRSHIDARRHSTAQTRDRLNSLGYQQRPVGSDKSEHFVEVQSVTEARDHLNRMYIDRPAIFRDAIIEARHKLAPRCDTEARERESRRHAL